MSEIKLSAALKGHFLRLYQIALCDGDFSVPELKILYVFAQERGVSRSQLDQILLEPQNLNELIPEELNDKIGYLCDFTEMIWADRVITSDERNFLEKYIRLFGFLEENVSALADYLIEAIKSGNDKHSILKELKD